MEINKKYKKNYKNKINGICKNGHENRVCCTPHMSGNFCLLEPKILDYEKKKSDFQISGLK